MTEALRARRAHAYGSGDPVLGILEREGEVRATCFRTPPRRPNLTPSPRTRPTPSRPVRPALGLPAPGVGADRDTAEAFAGAWRRHTGATPTPHERQRLYRLGRLTPPVRKDLAAGAWPPPRTGAQGGGIRPPDGPEALSGT
ncbi:hypothetical protein GTW52_24185 [Streptomyces sp. SID8358]|uniref:hypothetical protein n=1 Tax=Streptomyces sp. SID8358 TaxID=2690342 RepID=UPI000DAD66BA|nr:hypothetical protein [Streptomyces sp. SID8358]MYU36171.1 hypothetical protein [Streptomyces sp. SID8358]